MNDDLSGQFRGFKPFLSGGGELHQAFEVLRLSIPPVGPKRYVDAQIDDYHGLRRRSRFPWIPPLRVRLRARMSHPAASTLLADPARGYSGTHFHTSSHPCSDIHTPSYLLGTAGFGFWNDPFTLTGGGVLAPPSALWFFYASPPSDMALVEGVPGWGWKAATLDSARIPALVLAPAAAAAVLLTRLPGLGRPIMSAARRAMRVSERIVDAVLTEWHDYEIEWSAAEAVFRVDAAEVLRAPDPPRGPLGFVAWIDNQYAVATPQGRFGFGLIQTGAPQWMELEGVSILRLSPDEVR